MARALLDVVQLLVPSCFHEPAGTTSFSVQLEGQVGGGVRNVCIHSNNNQKGCVVCA
jgi:hypothetical protein